MKRILSIGLLILAGCTPITHHTTVPTNATWHDRDTHAPQRVEMSYAGPAYAGEGDPINECRVYVYKMNSYVQTAILCKKSAAATASGAHQLEATKD